jgi:hypothetical protein
MSYYGNPNSGGFYGGSQQGGFQQQQQQQQNQPPFNANQWQQPQAQQSQNYSYGNQNQTHASLGTGSDDMLMHQQLQQPTTAALQQTPSFWNPAAAATMAAVAGSVAHGGFSNDVTVDLAANAAKSFFASGTARMVPGLESSMLSLRTYFAVDNVYVVRKMKRILFPFLTKHWQRTVRLTLECIGASTRRPFLTNT